MKFNILLVLSFLLFTSFFSEKKEQITIIAPENSSIRTRFGIEKLAESLSSAGYKIVLEENKIIKKGKVIVVGEFGDQFIEKYSGQSGIISGKEGFTIKSTNNTIIISGADASGSLYGCLELSERIRENGSLPEKIDITDQPEMVLRGACIGMQKTTYLPGHEVYEYPYTPENFPWLYDKKLWLKYLDMMVENRMNSLYLWNGHPFASLVRLKDYPYALEVDDSTFKKNEEIFSFLTKEADKRGIWVIQMFYNIIVSKPFGEHHGIKTQDRSRPILPLISDYTRKSVSAFIQKYPNVGLLVCLGEAINTTEDDIEWFTGTILPGVKDGMKANGLENEPPVILRGHDTEPQKVMDTALPIYKNLYTMQKYNGESLTTYQPRGTWASIHQDLSKLGSVHISNVHILANLEPFRYGSPDFIQKSVQAMHDIQGANGLHLYPQASYWDWPYTADKTNPRLLQVDRDWIWYKAWARYAWNCRRDSASEKEYWSHKLNSFFGSKNGHLLVKAYEEAGQIAPKLLRRFGISDGNRQTLLLGMFMSQLVNPHKWTIYSNFYNSNGPEGEILIEWAEKEWNKEKHSGETPTQIIFEVLEHGSLAKDAINKATPFINENKDEFLRLKNDIYCYDALARFFANKVNAAMLVLNYKYSGNITDLEKAVPFLEKSVEVYTELVERTKDSYLYANSMQTGQRRIPVAGTDGKNKTWEELLPQYKTELENFKSNIAQLKNFGESGKKANQVFRPMDIEFIDTTYEFYSVHEGRKIYSDKDFVIQQVTDELKNIKGIKLSYDEQLKKGTTVHFKNQIPVKLLAGFFNGNSFRLLPPPTLETDANANNRGQADIRIANALNITGLYPVNVYTYYFEPGEHTLKLNKGLVLLLGFIEGEQEIKTFDAGIGTEKGAAIDWLFY